MDKQTMVADAVPPSSLLSQTLMAHLVENTNLTIRHNLYHTVETVQVVIDFVHQLIQDKISFLVVSEVLMPGVTFPWHTPDKLTTEHYDHPYTCVVYFHTNVLPISAAHVLYITTKSGMKFGFKEAQPQYPLQRRYGKFTCVKQNLLASELKIMTKLAPDDAIYLSSVFSGPFLGTNMGIGVRCTKVAMLKKIVQRANRATASLRSFVAVTTCPKLKEAVERYCHYTNLSVHLDTSLKLKLTLKDVTNVIIMDPYVSSQLLFDLFDAQMWDVTYLRTNHTFGDKSWYEATGISHFFDCDPNKTISLSIEKEGNENSEMVDMRRVSLDLLNATSFAIYRGHIRVTPWLFLDPHMMHMVREFCAASIEHAEMYYGNFLSNIAGLHQLVQFVNRVDVMTNMPINNTALSVATYSTFVSFMFANVVTKCLGMDFLHYLLEGDLFLLAFKSDVMSAVFGVFNFDTNLGFCQQNFDYLCHRMYTEVFTEPNFGLYGQLQVFNVFECFNLEEFVDEVLAQPLPFEICQ